MTGLQLRLILGESQGPIQHPTLKSAQQARRFWGGMWLYGSTRWGWLSSNLLLAEAGTVVKGEGKGRDNDDEKPKPREREKGVDLSVRWKPLPSPVSMCLLCQHSAWA